MAGPGGPACPAEDARLAESLDILSLALLGAAAVAFTRQRTVVLVVMGALFVPVAAAATLAVFWPLSPLVAILLLAATLGVSLVVLALYAVDRVFAPFCMEMTYPALICWVLWPILVAVDSLGLVAVRLVERLT